MRKKCVNLHFKILLFKNKSHTKQPKQQSYKAFFKNSHFLQNA